MAGVHIWKQVHADRLVRLGEVWVRLHGNSFGGESLLVGVAPVPWVASSEDGLCTRYQACSGWG